jgi:hypothetical protein
MKAIELLIINKSMIELLAKNDLDVCDVKYIEAYQEYARLMAEGHKQLYVMQYIEDEYEISKSTIKRLIKKFGKDVEL